MSSVYSKNCILMGELDSYCLVCSTHLPGEDKVLDHIRGLDHNDNLKSAEYYEKYKDDFIRKVNGIYFCQLCNMTFTTASKVGVHITEDKHVNGQRRLLERIGTSIIFQKNTLIAESAWNGLVEDTCVAACEDVATHQSEPAHVLNVVRSSVTVDDNNNIYRKVEDGFQCLTCNVVVSVNVITKHLTSVEHKSARVYKEDEEKVKENEENGNDVNIANITKSSKDNLSLSGTVCKTLHAKPAPIKEKEKTSDKSFTKEMEDLVQQHGLSVSKDKQTVNCNVCSYKVPATLSRVREHVEGKKHKTMVSKQPGVSKRDRRNTEKVKHVDFCKATTFVETKYGQFVIINQTLCIHSIHYVCLKNYGKIVCEFCNIDVTQANLNDHLASPLHADMILNSFVITSLEKEFVRQINSMYHCGHCGLVETDYDDMLDHLESPEHKKRKAQNEMILQSLKDEEIMRNRILLNPLRYVPRLPPSNRLF